jgi:hypothetical protein
MLEALLAEGVVRKDSKRITAMLRPLPIKQRDVFDLIIAQGREPSFQGILRSVELKGAEPRALCFVMLGRWPTAQEIAELPEPYRPKVHLRQLLQTAEFRSSFARRLLDAFPDRRRILFVRLPRCSGAHVLATAATRHPVIPAHIADAPRMSIDELLAAIGVALYRFNSASTAVLSASRLAPFLVPTQPLPDPNDILHWNIIPPPYRAGDTLFTVIREPRSLVLSQVNAILTGLRVSPANDGGEIAQLRARLDPLPPLEQTGAWKDVGRKILLDLSLRNPICEGLGNGTAETALAACRASAIELVGLSRQTDWVRTAFSSEPPAPINASEPILLWEDLQPDQRTQLDSLVAEDLNFYARFAEKFDPTQVSSVSGATL